ncbi:hypothetical protein [Methylopila sp. M107]|uniref:hypothetical protein n=1 Tax=Methylopila sp. M107 TaxID=1101190 RepID=UPI000366AEA2|nr:hypothetical protein [Methylopila sp. M107]
MTIFRPAALDTLEATAIEFGTAEREFRESYAREIARLETERRRAYRRFNLVATLVAADAGAADREASHAAQRQAALDELGWGVAEAAALEAMTPLADAIHDERLLAEAEAGVVSEGEDDPDAAELVAVSAAPDSPASARAAAILFALQAFEEGFEATEGKPFAAQFDRTFPETPLVDF